jgi:hypothetical protein
VVPLVGNMIDTMFDSEQTSLMSFDKKCRRETYLLPRGKGALMATQMESAPRPNKSRANSHSGNAEAQPEIDSSVVIKETRQDVEALNEEQRRELIATIWREIYGP